MAKMVCILISMGVGYLVALILTVLGIRKMVDLNCLSGKPIIGLPPFAQFTPFQFSKGIFAFDLNAIITCCIIAIAAMIEHIGDIVTISETCGKQFVNDPGLARTLLGDGIGTSLAGAFGGPANTTYSENTGVIALTKVTDPLVVEIAACFAIILSASPCLDAIIRTIPTCLVGGTSFVLYGMISAIGMRTVIEQKVDFSKTRNVLIAAIILVSGLGFNSHPVKIGSLQFGGLACAAILGIFLNLILPQEE